MDMHPSLMSFFDEAVRFFVKKYRIMSSIVYTFEDIETPNLNGYCYPSGEGVYTIVLRKDRFAYARLVTLFHELVHVHQMEKGSLVLFDDGVEWEGEYYPNEALFSRDEGGAYWELPWEVEAREAEVRLFSDFVNSLSLSRLLALKKLGDEVSE